VAGEPAGRKPAQRADIIEAREGDEARAKMMRLGNGVSQEVKRFEEVRARDNELERSASLKEEEVLQSIWSPEDGGAAGNVY